MRDPLKGQLSFRVTEELYDIIQRIAHRERRRPNEVARGLIERGVEQYKRDGQVFEPLEDDPFLLQSEDFRELEKTEKTRTQRLTEEAVTARPKKKRVA